MFAAGGVRSDREERVNDYYYEDEDPAYYRLFDSPGICLPVAGKSSERSAFTLKQCAATCTENHSCTAFEFLEEGGKCVTSSQCSSRGDDGDWIVYKKHECDELGSVESAESGLCVPCGGWGEECCHRENGMGLGPDSPCRGDFLCNDDNRCGKGQYICGEWQTETSSCYGDQHLEKLHDDEDLDLCKTKCLEKDVTGCCGVWTTNTKSGCYFKQGGIPAKDNEGTGQTIYCSTGCERKMMLCDEDCEAHTWFFFGTPDREHGNRCTSATNVLQNLRVRNICESKKCWSGSCEEVWTASPDICSWTNDGVVDGTLSQCQASCRNNPSYCFGIQYKVNNCDFITDANCDVRAYERGSGPWLIQSRSCFYHGVGGFEQHRTSSSEINDRVETNTTPDDEYNYEHWDFSAYWDDDDEEDSCHVLPQSTNPGFEDGCPGAVWGGGSPSQSYCTNTGSSNGRFKWWADCCEWEGDRCVPKPDSCQYANDGECDEPEYCHVGTDTTDCKVSTENPEVPTENPTEVLTDNPTEVDECGVSNGDGSSCADCAGVPNGGTVIDQCNVCGGDNTLCADCLGVPNGGAVIDQCNVCGGDNTQCADCLGVPNGGAVIDQCNVCGGDNTLCADCLGVPNGGAVIDQCNVCGGDNTQCADCLGVPNGGADYDECSVCGGDGTSCHDDCGVPNGDNTSCECLPGDEDLSAPCMPKHCTTNGFWAATVVDCDFDEAMCKDEGKAFRKPEGDSCCGVCVGCNSRTSKKKCEMKGFMDVCKFEATLPKRKRCTTKVTCNDLTARSDCKFYNKPKKNRQGKTYLA